jgi:hypothetical protein
MIDIRRAVPESGKTLTVALSLVVGLGALWFLANSITAGDFQTALLFGAAVTALAVVGKTLSDWRSGVYLFMVWLLFEDFIRKYLGNSMSIYFGKDVLIGATYVALLMSRLRGDDKERFRPPFKYALAMFVLLGVAQVFNPGSPSLWYGVLGLKLYFYYLPLMFVGYALLRSESDLQKFLFVNAGLAAVISVIGILQAIVGIDFLNPRSGADIDELGHNVRVTPSGLIVPRPPSVFVSEGRSFDYLILAFIVTLGAAGYLLLRTNRGRRIVFPAVGMVALAIILSGSRGDFVNLLASALLLSAAMLWGAPPKLGEGYRLVKAIRRTFVFVTLAVSLAMVLFPNVIGARLAFYRETIALDSPDSETRARAWDYPVGQLQKAFEDSGWLVGHGIGTASLGGQYVSRIMDVPKSNIGVESGYGALVIELGIAGLILWLAWTSSLMFAALKVLLRLKGTWAFPLALSFFWFAFYLLFPRTYGGMQGYQDFILNAYLWLLVGMLFRLPALVAEEQQQQVAANTRELVSGSR